MYLVPVIGQTVSFSRQTSGPGNRTFMFLQTYRKDGHGACLGFGHFEHPVTTYDSLPVIRENKTDSGLHYALTVTLGLRMSRNASSPATDVTVQRTSSFRNRKGSRFLLFKPKFSICGTTLIF
ncbi:hypothetical protein MMALV_06640 [Candidatus Methanomethylophilus alvi Mx1201]|uniref:Uncharacterized protein n=1 Tax=Methanomethylophilus alvi (strain Mx1201) TaxID=1236689 RepID=M9SGZ1_METAX|nr:hypothetical protein MMALV_06640 [Candidatus Methanomethylophilus alvi Mx1201]